MTQSLAVRARAARQSSERPAPPLDAPRLLRSSEELGWEGFTVRTFDEPPVMEHWRAPDTPALTLVMVTQGVMQVEQRRLDGPWEAHTLHPGDLFLRPPGRAPYELRWWAGSQAPMRTMHLQVQPSAVLQSAAALKRGDPAAQTLIERVGLRDPLLAQLCAALAGMLAQATTAESVAAQTAVQLVLAHILRHQSVRGAPADQPQSLGVLELTALPSIEVASWVAAIQEADALLVSGGDVWYLCRWMRESGLAELLPSLRETVYKGGEPGSGRRPSHVGGLQLQ